MLLKTDHARLTLQKDDMAHLTRACDTRLDCVDGVAWITVDGDRRDVVLEAGESFLVESDANVIVCALGGVTAVEVRSRVGHAPCAAPRPVRQGGVWPGMQAWMRSAMAAAA